MEIANLCINTIRAMSADLPQIANSGHPGAPMGLAPVAYTLWGHVMKYDPKNGYWNRDRFVLSNGHCSALLYSMLHLTGYDLTLKDLKNFRKLNSKTPGHPESFMTDGVEVCTGPLGQGISNAVGLAIGAHHMSAKYNMVDVCKMKNIKNVYLKALKCVNFYCGGVKGLNHTQSLLFGELKEKFEGFVNDKNYTQNDEEFNEDDILFDHFVYCIVGDGCLQEGISAEASSLAGHLGLSKLIVLYDDNKITIDGPTNLSFTENVKMRYISYGWNVYTILEGDSDWLAIYLAILNAQTQFDKPTLICVKTTIGYGSSKQGTEKTHGSPLGEADLKQFKQSIGFDPNKFLHVPQEVKEFFTNRTNECIENIKHWKLKYDKYEINYPKKFEELNNRLSTSAPKALYSFLGEEITTAPPQSTRAMSGICLNMCAKYMPDLIGGSADLTISNATALENENNFNKNNFENRYIRFGVREHAMAAISNGLAAHGGFRPFCSTFLNFLTYAWGAVRLSALASHPVLYICTHDSIELGEDGPTHQPVEVLSLLRATPNIFTMRPADMNEVKACYFYWLLENRPVVLCLSRSPTPHIKGTRSNAFIHGAYIISDFESNGGEKIILGASGTELAFCVQAKELLEIDGFDVRVISFLCWELFADTTNEYKGKLFPPNTHTTNVYVEASSSLEWAQYFKFNIGMSGFGKSAPKLDLQKHFGFTAQNVYKFTKSAVLANTRTNS